MKSLVLTILTATSLVGTISFLNPNAASAGPIRDRQVNQQERIYKECNKELSAH